MLKEKDIQIMYSKKVEDYFKQGYVINVNSMSGHQGEICKVDLKKGNEVIRVLLIDCSWVKVDDHFEDYIALQVRRYETLDYGLKSHNTLWINDGELIDEVRFYKVSLYEEVYTADYEEYKNILKLQSERRNNKYMSSEVRINIDSKKLLKIVKTKPGFKTTRLLDIIGITRSKCSTGYYYTIKVHGRNGIKKLYIHNKKRSN